MNPKLILRSVLQQLNAGVLQTAILSECLSVDFAVLMATVFPEINSKAIDRMNTSESLGITKRMALAAEILSERLDSKSLILLLDYY